MSIISYEAPYSSATPVACALAELAVPHEKVRLDIKQGDTRKPEFLAINPNGRVPTLVVDGTTMFEALAIITWLGDRYGVAAGKWPAADSPARLEALSWSTWAYVSFGPVVQRKLLSSSDQVAPETHNAAQAALAQSEVDRLLGVLEQRLTGREYVLGKGFSLADLILACTLTYATYSGVSIAEQPHIEGWLKRCQERPSFRSAWGG